MAGKVYIVGGGPGDAGLITVKGARILSEADAVYVGPSVSGELLSGVRKAAEVIHISGSEGRSPLTRRGVRRELIERARKGQKVVWLVSGDPFMFMHGSDEGLALRAAQVDFEIIPGVPGLLAAPFYAGIPVTHPGVSGSVTIMLAREGDRGFPSMPTTPPVREETGRPSAESAGAQALDQSVPPVPGGELVTAPESVGRPPERRIGRSVIVRSLRRSPPSPPLKPGTPIPMGLRKPGPVEIVDDSQTPAVGAMALEKPLLRDRTTDAIDVGPEELGTYPSTDWSGISTISGTLVISVGRDELESVAARLVHSGRGPEEHAAVIMSPATNRQVTVAARLSTIARVSAISGIHGECVLVVGDTVALRDRLNWFEQRPLFGFRVALTDLDHRAREQAACLEEAGAVTSETPLVRVAQMPGAVESILEAAQRLDQYAMIVFTSPVTVRIFLDILWKDGTDPRQLSGPRLISVFPATTAELTRYGLQPDILVEELPRRGLAAKLGLEASHRVLLPRAARARDLLPLQLGERGTQVEIIPVYDTIPDERGAECLRRLLLNNDLDLIVHGSSSGFEYFWEMTEGDDRGVLLSRVGHGCTGTLVSRNLQSRGIKPAFELQDPNPGDLRDAVVDYAGVLRTAGQSEGDSSTPPI